MDTSLCPLPSLDWRSSTEAQRQADLLLLNAALHTAGISEQLIFLPQEHTLALYLQHTDDHGALWITSMPEPYQLDPPEDDPEDLWDAILYAHRHPDPGDLYAPDWTPMPSEVSLAEPSPPFPLAGIIPQLWDIHSTSDLIQQDFARYNTALHAAGISDSLIGLRYHTPATGDTPYDTYLLHKDSYGTAWIARVYSINAAECLYHGDDLRYAPVPTPEPFGTAWSTFKNFSNPIPVRPGLTGMSYRPQRSLIEPCIPSLWRMVDILWLGCRPDGIG